MPAWLLNLRKSFTSGAAETDFEQLSALLFGQIWGQDPS